MDCSLPGSFVHGIFQARVLELGATALGLHNASFQVSLKIWDNLGPSVLRKLVFSQTGLERKLKRDKIVEKAVGGFTSSTLEMLGKGGDLELVFDGL